ncbi:MAG: hypothetical protein DWQ04_00170 [Chloroflexi bacterium]|nr:MAG: hypothetical protein DWQ04_00170 [Chloroflexota bacterium]
MTENDLAKTAPDVLILSGTVGAGKTAVSYATHDILSAKNIPHACLDLDCFSYSWPPLGAFNSDTVFDVLEKVWPVYMQKGASKLILARVVESESEIRRYSQVLKTQSITLIRVTASEEVRKSRLKKRELGASLTWHLNRTTQLEKILEKLMIENFVITNENRSVEHVAEEALKLVKWLPER